MPQTRTLTPPSPDAAPAQERKYKLDELDAARMAEHLVLFEPSDEVLTDLVAMARESIPGIASASEAIRIQRHNPGCVVAVAHKSKFDPANPKAEGFIAILPLNSLGMELLAHDALEATKPNTKFICKPDERPACIYWWAIFAPGLGAASMALFMETLVSERYAGLDIYCRPITNDGRDFVTSLGFTESAEIADIYAPHLWKFLRKPVLPLYDSYVPHSRKKDIGITVARTSDDITRVAAIRSAVYIGEQQCPYDEEFDGNDWSATHLLAYIGDEPVGCMRLRFFADFAKFERVAIRKEFRKSRAAIKLVQAGLQLCRKKGYRRVIGHAQTRLASFWTRFGFYPMQGRKPFVFSDYDYIEMVAELERDPEALTIEADPYQLIRPEGRWHIPGILEDSTSRAATNPSVARKA